EPGAGARLDADPREPVEAGRRRRRQREDAHDARLVKLPVAARHGLLRGAEDLGDPAKRGARRAPERVEHLAIEAVDRDGYRARIVGHWRKSMRSAVFLVRRSEPRHTSSMRKWLPLTAICLGTFMLLIDVTIVNVALPDMATDLHTAFTQLQWVIDIYALALAALLLGIGSFADLVGRKPVYIGGLVLFAAASLAAGLSGSTTVLIAARGVQGVGGAAMFATNLA